MNRRIIVIGANGQVGSDIIRAAAAKEVAAVGLRHADCDVTDAASVERALQGASPDDVIIDTAAFHQTDACEDAPERALSVNALGAFNVARTAKKHGAAMAYTSSDYVFDGTKQSPYVESDAPNPVSVYGASKAAGEMLVRVANPAHYIVRLSSVFGIAGSSGKGGNFVETMIAKSRSGTSPVVVDNIVMAPTSAADAAGLLLELITRNAPYGTYHLANAGQCSWYEFAEKILALSGSAIRAERIASATLATRARRPAYSVLASQKLGTLGLKPRAWQDGLRDYLQAKGYLRPEPAHD